MSVLVYTAEQLINSLRNLGTIPDTGSLGTRDADLLTHLNEELRENIIPEIAMIREKYFVKRRRDPLVSGRSRYRFPARAMWNKANEIWYIDTNKDRGRLPLIDESMVEFYNESGADSPVGYIIEGNWILLIPDKSSAFEGELEWVYYHRPGDLVLSTAARQVKTVDSTTAVTLESAPPAGWTVGVKMDIHSAESGAEVKSYDLTIGDVTSNTITFDEVIDGSLFGTKPVEVGDWVCLAKEAAVPGIPVEAHPLLVRATAARIAESLGDQQAVQTHEHKSDKTIRKNIRQMEQRIEEKPIKLGGRGMINAIRRRYW